MPIFGPYFNLPYIPPYNGDRRMSVPVKKGGNRKKNSTKKRRR